MPRERTFILLLVTFVLGGMAFGQLRSTDRILHMSLLEKLPGAIDRPESRVWLDPQLELLSTSAEGELVLRHVGIARSGPGDLILALDWADAAVKAIDGSGLVKWQVPVTPDVDSDSSVLATDLALVANQPSGHDELWVADRSAPRIRIFEPGGHLVRTVDLQTTAERFVLAPDGGFTVLTVTAGTHLFESYGPEGELRRRFGRLLAGDVQEPLLLAGSLAADSSGGVILAPFYLGILAAFDASGECRFVVETVGGDDRDAPRVLEARSSRRLEPGAPLRSLAVEVDGDRIYVLSERATAASKSRIVDVYASADGTYIHSFRLPSGPRGLLVDGDELVMIHKDRIERWLARAGLGG